MTRVGFLGLGRMGCAMAPRLLEAGYALTVWNRTPERADSLVANGANTAATPADLAAEADIVISMLADDAAVLDVFEGPDGLLSTPVEGKLFIDMSTLRPSTVIALAERIQAKGAGLVDAPVSGTVGPAKDGQLLVLCGASDADFDRAQPILKVFGRRIVHAGTVGRGALLKLVVNLPLAVYWASLAEAIAMGKLGGLDLQLMLETIQDSSAALAVLPLKIPSILTAGGPVAFDVSGVQKDLLSMLDTGKGLGVPMPTTEAVLGTYSAAADGGFAASDAVEVVRFLAEHVPSRK